MDRWSQKFVSCWNDWRTQFVVNHRANRIANEIFIDLRDSVRRKAVPLCDRQGVADYAFSRATQLCYSKVDELVARDPRLSGAVAAKIISTSTTRAVDMVSGELPRLRRVVGESR